MGEESEDNKESERREASHPTIATEAQANSAEPPVQYAGPRAHTGWTARNGAFGYSSFAGGDGIRSMDARVLIVLKILCDFPDQFQT